MNTQSTATAGHSGAAQSQQQDAGHDAEIRERLENDPSDLDAQLDAALDQSMDASDPAAPVQPGDTGEPVPSSGFDPDAEQALRSK